jgi:hypothetical protein
MSKAKVQMKFKVQTKKFLIYRKEPPDLAKLSLNLQKPLKEMR